MRKTSNFILVVLFLYSMIFAQTQQSQQTNYSESTPYSPHKFNNQQPKSQKDKKNKTKASSEKQTRSIDNAPQKTIDENKSINIPISVFDSNNQPMIDLQKADFKIFINDQEQEISSFTTEEQPLNLILVLDTSPSTAYEIEAIRNFASNIADTLKPRDKMQLIEFSANVNILSELTNDRQIIKKAVKKLKIGDGTSLYEAIKFIFQNQIKTLEERKTIVLLTDAVDTTSRTANYETSLTEAEKNDAVVFPFYIDTFENRSKIYSSTGGLFPPSSVIGQILDNQLLNLPTTSKADYELGKQYLFDLALLSGGRAIEIKNLAKLKTTDLATILNLLKPRYFITVDTKNIDNLPPRGQIKVRVNRPNLIVQSRGSYVAKKS